MTHLAKRNWLLQTWTCVLHDFRAKICCNKQACASFNSQGNDCNVPQVQRCSHQMAFIRLMTCSTLKFRFHRENIPSETVIYSAVENRQEILIVYLDSIFFLANLFSLIDVDIGLFWNLNFKRTNPFWDKESREDSLAKKTEKMLFISSRRLMQYVLRVTGLGGLPGLPGRVTLSAGVTIRHVNVSRWGNPPNRGRFHGKKFKSETRTL